MLIFCISVYCFPKNASCQFTTKTQWHQPDNHVSSTTKNTEGVHSSFWEERQLGWWANLGTPQIVLGALELQEGQRAGSGKRSAPATMWTQVTAGWGGVT